MPNKMVVYTALFGDYDELIDPVEGFQGCDFICFTDQTNLKSDIWDIRFVKNSSLTPKMMNRYYKFLPHLFMPEYECSLYVDSNILILKNPCELKDKYLTDVNFAIPRHIIRSCIFDEAEVLLRSGRVSPFSVFRQMISYRKEGYTCQNSLGENNILLRRHNKVIDIMRRWWLELHLFSKRDQLSLMFVLWKLKADYLLIDENSRNGDYFFLKSHKSSPSKGKFKVFIYFIIFSIPYHIMKKLYLKRAL